MGSILLAGIGGSLIVYGFNQRSKTRPQSPQSNNEFIHLVAHESDPVARTDGNLAMAIGIIFLLGSAFA